MKRILIVPLALMFIVGSATAAPLCVQASLSTYESLATACQIGDKLFYGFTYSGSALAPADTGITVGVVTGNSSTNPGLRFSSFGFLVYGGETLDATITYNVVTLSGASILEDYSLNMAGAYVGSTPTLGANQGTGTVTESFSSPTGSSLVDQVVPGGVSTISGHLAFSPYFSGTTVTTTIHMVLPESDPGYITISAIQEGFSEQLPEPYAVVLIGSGLCFLGVCRKRVKC